MTSMMVNSLHFSPVGLLYQPQSFSQPHFCWPSLKIYHNPEISQRIQCQNAEVYELLDIRSIHSLPSSTTWKTTSKPFWLLNFSSVRLVEYLLQACCRICSVEQENTGKKTLQKISEGRAKVEPIWIPTVRKPDVKSNWFSPKFRLKFRVVS